MYKKTSILICLIVFQITFLSCLYAQGTKDLHIIKESNRVALVIGNSNYQNGFSSLKSPKNDATGMAAVLKRLGFRLVGGKAQLDVTYDQMNSLINQFSREIENGGVGLFYFSGHGSQNDSHDNFLIPVDTSINYQRDLSSLAINVDDITKHMKMAKNRLNILVLDACRNNSLPNGSKSLARGLNTSIEIPEGLYIAFAASSGQTASDGDSNSFSLYTEKLLQNIETPNERLEDIFIDTRLAVENVRGEAQIPADYGTLNGAFYFILDPDNPNVSTDNASDRSRQAKEFFNQGLRCGGKDYDCQISNFSQGINLNRNYAQAYNYRGAAYFGKGNYDQAIEDFDDALRLNPNYATAYFNRGGTYKEKGQYRQAISDLTEYINLVSDDSNAYLIRGAIHYNRGNYDQAIEDCDEVLRLDPNNATAYYNRGNAKREKNNYQEAISDLTKYITLAPDTADGYLTRGNTYLTGQDYQEAISDLTKYITLAPDDADGYLIRGAAYSGEKNYDQAIEDLNNAIGLNRNYVKAYNYRGAAYFGKGNYDQALENFNEAIRLDPNFSSAYYNRGNIYRVKRNYQQAVSDLTIYINLAPRAADGYIARAAAYDGLGEKEKARADRNKAKELGGNP